MKLILRAPKRRRLKNALSLISSLLALSIVLRVNPPSGLAAQSPEGVPFLQKRLDIELRNESFSAAIGKVSTLLRTHIISAEPPGNAIINITGSGKLAKELIDEIAKQAGLRWKEKAGCVVMYNPNAGPIHNWTGDKREADYVGLFKLMDALATDKRDRLLGGGEITTLCAYTG